MDKEAVKKIQAEIAWLKKEIKGYRKDSTGRANLKVRLKEAQQRLAQAKKK